MSLLDLGERFLDLMETYSIESFPMIREGEDAPEADLTLVEGTVRHANHLALLRRVRERGGSLVALGSCAVFGGVQGLSDATAGGRWKESVTRANAGEHIPLFTRRVLPLDAYVAVDFRLPGCPVPMELLWSFLGKVADGSFTPRDSATVCAECMLRGGSTRGGPFRFTEKKNESGTCFLEQGFLCMGPTTRDGCGAYCPISGYPCRGCRGPTDGVMWFQPLDPRRESWRRLSRSTGRREHEVAEFYRDPAHAFFTFCLGEPLFRNRRWGGTPDLIRRIETGDFK